MNDASTRVKVVPTHNKPLEQCAGGQRSPFALRPPPHLTLRARARRCVGERVGRGFVRCGNTRIGTQWHDRVTLRFHIVPLLKRNCVPAVTAWPWQFVRRTWDRPLEQCSIARRPPRTSHCVRERRCVGERVGRADVCRCVSTRMCHAVARSCDVTVSHRATAQLIRAANE